MKNILVIIGLVAASLLGIYSFFISTERKTAFVFNQRVFEGFKGKIELEEKLAMLKKESMNRFDSLSVQALDDNGSVYYDNEKRKAELMFEELSEKYTADVWKRINEYVSTYGDERGYEFIFGATGDGNLMYAQEAKDVTDEVIEYINKKYDGR